MKYRPALDPGALAAARGGQRRPGIGGQRNGEGREGEETPGTRQAVPASRTWSSSDSCLIFHLQTAPLRMLFRSAGKHINWIRLFLAERNRQRPAAPSNLTVEILGASDKKILLVDFALQQDQDSRIIRLSALRNGALESVFLALSLSPSLH
jgi:hypothetical protein